MLPKVILYEEVPEDLLARLDQQTDLTVLETFEGVSDSGIKSQQDSELDTQCQKGIVGN